jgi:hypothetical protein
LAVAEDTEWRNKFKPAGWTGKNVDFLIWPRASWAAIRPDRYWRWELTRDTIPASERNEQQPLWRLSILSGNGEWSEAKTIIGVPPGTPP